MDFFGILEDFQGFPGILGHLIWYFLGFEVIFDEFWGILKDSKGFFQYFEWIFEIPEDFERIPEILGN